MAEHDVKVKRGTSFTVFCRPRTGSAAAPQAGDSLGTGGKEAGARGEGSRGETATVRKGIGAAFLRGQPRCRRAPRPNGRSTPGHTEQGPARPAGGAAHQAFPAPPRQAEQGRGGHVRRCRRTTRPRDPVPPTPPDTHPQDAHNLSSHLNYSEQLPPRRFKYQRASPAPPRAARRPGQSAGNERLGGGA